MSNEIKNKIEDALYNFYLEADKETINDTLKEDIQDVEAYGKKKKQIIFMAKAVANKKHNEYLLQLASQYQDAILKNIEKPIAFLKQLIQTNESFSLYRNLDKLSQDDIIEIIKDKNLMDLLENLEENEKEK